MSSLASVHNSQRKGKGERGGVTTASLDVRRQLMSPLATRSRANSKEIRYGRVHALCSCSVDHCSYRRWYLFRKLTDQLFLAEVYHDRQAYRKLRIQPVSFSFSYGYGWRGYLVRPVYRFIHCVIDMRKATRVTKTEWYQAGGFENSLCYRKGGRNNSWTYYILFS